MDISGAYQELIAKFIIFLPKIVVSLVVFIISLILAGLLSRLVKKAMERRKADVELTLLMGQLTRWGTVILGTIIALQQVNFDVTAFLTGLGILGFTIGFAIQDVSKNFIAGILLLLQQPFDIGDAISVVDLSGTVKTIDLRATVLRTFDGKDVMIPNADIYTNPIINYGRATSRRVELDVGVSYDSNLDQVQEIATSTLSSIEGVLQDPAPNIVFNNFGPSTIDFTAYYWVDTDIIGVLGGTHAGVKGIKVAFEKESIDMPYPTQTVLLKQ